MDIRFFIIGYDENRGYGIKDLNDNMVEWYDKQSVLDLAKRVKIYGVVKERIDLDWFRSYYSMCVMAYGVDRTAFELGITVNSLGSFALYDYGIDSYINYKRFFEFAESFTEVRRITGSNKTYDQDISYMLLNGVCDCIVNNNSALLHIKDKLRYIGNISARYFDELDIQYALNSECVVFFINRDKLVIDNFKMKCDYRIYNSGTISICCNIPEGVNLNIVIRDHSMVCISNKCDMDRLSFDIMENFRGRIKIYIEDGVDIQKLLSLFNDDVRQLLSLHKCDFYGGNVTMYRNLIKLD